MKIIRGIEILYMIPNNLSKDIKGYLQIEYLDIMDSYTIIQRFDSSMNF